MREKLAGIREKFLGDRRRIKCDVGESEEALARVNAERDGHELNGGEEVVNREHGGQIQFQLLIDAYAENRRGSEYGEKRQRRAE